MGFACQECGKVLATPGGLDVHRAQWCAARPPLPKPQPGRTLTPDERRQAKRLLLQQEKLRRKQEVAGRRAQRAGRPLVPVPEATAPPVPAVGVPMAPPPMSPREQAEEAARLGEVQRRNQERQEALRRQREEELRRRQESEGAGPGPAATPAEVAVEPQPTPAEVAVELEPTPPVPNGAAPTDLRPPDPPGVERPEPPRPEPPPAEVLVAAGEQSLVDAPSAPEIPQPAEPAPAPQPVAAAPVAPPRPEARPAPRPIRSLADTPWRCLAGHNGPRYCRWFVCDRCGDASRDQGRRPCVICGVPALKPTPWYWVRQATGPARLGAWFCTAHDERDCPRCPQLPPSRGW